MLESKMIEQSPPPKSFPKSPFLALGILLYFVSLGLRKVLDALIHYCMLHSFLSDNDELMVTIKT